MFFIRIFPFLSMFNPLSANFTKWSNTLKQFVGNLPTNCLSVFDHFLELMLWRSKIAITECCRSTICSAGLVFQLLENMFGYLWLETWSAAVSSTLSKLVFNRFDFLMEVKGLLLISVTGLMQVSKGLLSLFIDFCQVFFFEQKVSTIF